MSMVFCVGCGKEIHETAPTCPGCGAPQAKVNVETETEVVSESWQKKFDLLEKAGGVKLPKIKSLPLGERMKIGFNIWGFLFGPIYYLTKGMWRKAISLMAVALLIIVVLEVVCGAIGISSAITNFVAAAIFSSRATIDYYKKVKLNDNGWW